MSIDLEREMENIPMIECPGCVGLGYIDIGDPEEGITDSCPQCDGECLIEDIDD